MEKRYRVSVQGDLQKRTGHEGVISGAVRGRPAESTYRILGYDADRDMSEVEVQMKTGRYHQIRVHFAEEGFPLAGDRQHGGRMSGEGPLALCAEEVRFTSRMLGREVRGVVE